MPTTRTPRTTQRQRATALGAVAGMVIIADLVNSYQDRGVLGVVAAVFAFAVLFAVLLVFVTWVDKGRQED